VGVRVRVPRRAERGGSPRRSPRAVGVGGAPRIGRVGVRVRVRVGGRVTSTIATSGRGWGGSTHWKGWGQG